MSSSLPRVNSGANLLLGLAEAHSVVHHEPFPPPAPHASGTLAGSSASEAQGRPGTDAGRGTIKRTRQARAFR